MTELANYPASTFQLAEAVTENTTVDEAADSAKKEAKEAAEAAEKVAKKRPIASRDGRLS